MEEHDTLAAALVAALAELTNIAKSHEGGGGGKRYTFANIADLVAETRPVLADHGLVALTSVHGYEGRLACTVEIVHTSGETKKFDPLPFPEGNDAQSSGSWMTYMRRYALLAALGMGTEDDDGAKAQPRQRTERRQPQRRSGLDERTAYNQLIDHLIAEGKQEQDAVALAAAVWSEVKPKVADGVLGEGEWDRLRAEADGRLEAKA